MIEINAYFKTQIPSTLDECQHLIRELLNRMEQLDIDRKGAVEQCTEAIKRYYEENRRANGLKAKVDSLEQTVKSLTNGRN